MAEQENGWDDLVVELESREQELKADYERLVQLSSQGTQRKLAKSMLRSQSFQLDCLALLQRSIPEDFQDFGTVTHDHVNLRQDPDGHSPLVREVHQNTRLVLMGKEGFWHYVQLWDGTEGYIFQDYVRADEG